MSDLEVHLDRFYTLLGRLDAVSPQGRRLDEQSGRSSWPARGVYFFREPGETRNRTPATPRVVRVGTHAVSVGSKSKLWGRLRTHRGGNAGNGNHRGSIFRLHVGAAILARDGLSLATWGQRSSAPRSVRDTEAFLEKRVSEHIGCMSVVWVDVPDEPGPASMRSFIERNSIALLSNDCCPIDRPSDGWLGNFSPREEIRRSALWNLNYVNEKCDTTFLDVFEECVIRTYSATRVL
jgi:hypothetical protein